MKKTYLLAGFTSLLMACNSNSPNNADNHKTSTHMEQHKNTADTTNADQKNPITATMDKMMQEMHGTASTGNNEIDFAAMMLEHHKGAVAMSEVAIEKGNNATLKAFAQKVIDDQNKEIEWMQNFISKAATTTSSNAAAFQQALNHSMMAIMSNNTTIYNDIDKDFAAQMIPHHQSAVDMAKAYLQYGKEAGLTSLCQNIIATQTKEINWLQEWLAKNK